MQQVIVFVDVQNDFMLPTGSLYVKDAEKIIDKLALIQLAARLDKDPDHLGTGIIYTQDWHQLTDSEISNTPDFAKTFPPHCIADTQGAELVEPIKEFYERGSFIRKSTFDAFEADRFERTLFGMNQAGNLKPNVVYVCGVTAEICVNFVVQGLRHRHYNVCVVEDAIKALPNYQLDKLIEVWKCLGVTMIDTVSLVNKLINEG
jgi:nicotinamidase/pyrazinamidase